MPSNLFSSILKKTVHIKYPLVLPVISAAVLTATNVQAALVTGWTEVNAGNSVVVTNAGTASPTVGTGAEGSADTAWLQASFTTISLPSEGSSITLSGSATFTGISGASTLRDMFRIGLYDVNGSANDTGWLGYFATNGDAAQGGRIYERINPNTASFSSSTGATTLVADATAPGVNFESGAASTYNFSLILTRVGTGMQIDTSIIRASDSVQMGAGSFLDTTRSVSDFNRVGFLLGGNLDVDTVQFNNITVVPEPSAALLGGLGLLALLRRRRN